MAAVWHTNHQLGQSMSLLLRLQYAMCAIMLNTLCPITCREIGHDSVVAVIGGSAPAPCAMYAN